MQAQRLNHTGGLFFQLTRHRFKGIGCKQLAVRLQFCHLRVAFLNIGRCDIRPIGILFCHRLQDSISIVGLIHGDNVIGDLVHHMDRTGANIQHDMVTAQYILMNHINSLSIHMKNAAEIGGISEVAITCSPWCSRTADWQCRSWSCRQTDKKFGTRRSRHFSHCHTDCEFRWSEYVS